jgi:hypothetical protein
MQKIDFKKTMKAFWQPPADRFSIVEVPAMQFAMVDGKGDPNLSDVYQNAVQWLYSVSYGLKFMSKKELARDYPCRRWRGCGGPTTWTPSSRATRQPGPGP